MKIGGLQKLSLIDFPQTPSSVIFTNGCNFRCPYCHNPSLVYSQGKSLDCVEVMAFLKNRLGIIEGIVISGGEPTLQQDILAYCKELKTMGFKVKLDTNGSRPNVLKELLLSGLVDYVAMDLKSQKYPIEIFGEDVIKSIENSKQILESTGILHEFRITCVHGVVEPDDIKIILEGIKQDTLVYLQETQIDKQVLDPLFFESNKPWSRKIMEDVAHDLNEEFNISIR